jgi:hypothetical protein
MTGMQLLMQSFKIQNDKLFSLWYKSLNICIQEMEDF